MLCIMYPRIYVSIYAGVKHIHNNDYNNSLTVMSYISVANID